MTQQGCYGGGRRQEEPYVYHPHKRKKRGGGGRVCGWMCGHELEPNQLSRDLSLSIYVSFYTSWSPSHLSFSLFLSLSISLSIAVTPAHSCGLHSLWLIHKHQHNLLTSSHFPLPTRPLRKASAKITSHHAPYAAITIHHGECKRGLGVTWQEALESHIWGEMHKQ